MIKNKIDSAIFFNNITIPQISIMLAHKNPHERDACISFEEGPHIYTIDGDSDYTSVTTFNHRHFEGFDADAIITKMMSRKNWSNSKYFGQTPEQIKEGWEANRDAAATAGTKMHYDIECYYNDIPHENNSVEYTYFKNFLAAFPDLRPYRTEWMIWDKELKLAGSIDMVYENPDGSLMIYDWKRSKGIVKTTPWAKSSTTECIEHIPDTNFWHYSLQLNTYKALIEKNYGKKVTDLYLVCLYPENKNYQMMRVPNLQSEVSDLFEMRLRELKMCQ
jgi:ATP-dependent exoDNAse (exonuclease V) beta subunit